MEEQIPYFEIKADYGGKLYFEWQINPIPKNVSIADCFRFYRPCKKKLRRIHWTCLTCKYRRVAQGKYPRKYYGQAYILPIPDFLPKWKAKILKYLLTIAEALV